MIQEKTALTVAICTFNRAKLLRPLVKEIILQAKSAPCKILIVDNSSNNEDRDAASQLAVLPNVSVIYSTPPGLSRARNVAIENCKTKVIAFLDDDAFPLKGWLEAVLAPFDDSSIGFVAGPIIPIWPSEGRPNWIPEKYVGCLTTLDLGAEDKMLAPHEYAYGANMAFRTDSLREAGCFDASLGRAGNSSLLSNEEIDIQDKLRSNRLSGFYAAAAVAHHFVEKERLTRHWFLSRMAWQGVSTSLHSSKYNQDYLLTEFQRAAERCGLDTLPATLLHETDPEKFEERLTLVSLLVSYLLRAKSMKDINADTINQTGIDAQQANTGIGHHPSAATPPDTEYLFFDARPGHHYLYDLYGQIPHSHLVISDVDQWNDQDGNDISFFSRSINHGVKAIIMLTLDPYLFGPNSPHFYNLIQQESSRRKVFGILHKLPESAQDIERLTRSAPYLDIIVLDETLQELTRELIRSQKVRYLPHHAILEHFLSNPEEARKRRQLPKDKIIVSMLGEIRDGKGIDRLLDALPYLPPEIKSKTLFLIAGNARDTDPLDIKKKFLSEAVSARIVSERLESGYKLVSDPELADYVSASDIGLLLFEKAQKVCMSGILPNYVASDKPVIACNNSVVGQFVKKHDLGWVTDISSPKELAETLTAAIQSGFKNNADAPIKQQISSGLVLQTLEEILQQ